nr:MAG TPA: hypothetical protein [Caudoviricetes sp.]
MACRVSVLAGFQRLAYGRTQVGGDDLCGMSQQVALTLTCIYIVVRCIARAREADPWPSQSPINVVCRCRYIWCCCCCCCCYI